MDIYHTENSIYEIDLTRSRYRRMPRVTQPVHSERLEYETWLALADIAEPVHVLQTEEGAILHIMHESSVLGIYTTPIVFMAKDAAPC